MAIEKPKRTRPSPRATGMITPRAAAKPVLPGRSTARPITQRASATGAGASGARSKRLTMPQPVSTRQPPSAKAIANAKAYLGAKTGKPGGTVELPVIRKKYETK